MVPPEALLGRAESPLGREKPGLAKRASHSCNPLREPPQRALGAGNGNRRRQRRHQGFTLIELIVVMGLLATLSAIAFSTALAKPGREGVQGAGAMVVDLLRQARHTALSTGAPVEVRLQPDGERWVVRGVSQRPVISFQFEGNDRLPGVSWTYDELVENAGMISDFGYVGRGLATRGPSEIVFDLPRRPKLLSRVTDGLWVEAMVFLPAAYQNDGEHGIEYHQVDVLRLYADDPTNPLLVLRVEVDEGATTTDPALAPVVKDIQWKPVAVFYDGTDRVAIEPAAEPFGGRWMRLAVHYFTDETDQQRVAFYRDGQHIGSDHRFDADDTGFHTAWITPAQLRLKLGWEETADGNSGTLADVPTVIDNVRILAAGDDQPLRLPRTVVAEAPARVLFDPDGSHRSDGTIVLRDRNVSGNRARVDFVGTVPKLALSITAD